MNTKLKTLALLGLFTLPATIMADELTSTINATTDYTFNGVSQTDNGPALQASLDYALDSGWYMGAWASNVDFGSGEDTWLELDFYVGNYMELTDRVSLDAGIAYYTYHGDDASDEYYYPEIYSKFGYSSSLGQSELNFWYSWDYFGLDSSDILKDKKYIRHQEEFICWYMLQHLRGYKPFITFIPLKYKFKGTLHKGNLTILKDDN